VIALPAALGGPATLSAWRIDAERFRDTWDRGEGARLHGGRWNSPGRAAVYLSIEPATAILEVAVHKNVTVLGRLPHVMTAVVLDVPAKVMVVQPEDVPNREWLRPGWPTQDQQAYGDTMLAQHPMVLLPSVVSPYSWNLVWNPATARGLFRVAQQESFTLDSRLREAV